MSITLAEEKLKLSLPDHTQLPESEGQTVADENLILYWPDHTQLPESDGTFVKNFQEHPQSILLTDSITPVLQQMHPDGQYIIGQDSGIYWRLTQEPEPKVKGAVSPDWFYVGNVSPLLNGERRRSYVLWHEHIIPLIAIEFVSGDGFEERDITPRVGKFWIYENVIQVPFYAIYEVDKSAVEVYSLINENYQLLPANERGHYPILPLGIELGIWDGVYQNMRLPWLRFWDLQGNLLLSGQELANLADQRANLADQRAIQADQRAESERQKAELERQKAELERQKAELERQKAERLAAQLKALGIEPEI